MSEVTRVWPLSTYISYSGQDPDVVEHLNAVEDGYEAAWGVVYNGGLRATYFEEVPDSDFQPDPDYGCDRAITAVAVDITHRGGRVQTISCIGELLYEAALHFNASSRGLIA